MLDRPRLPPWRIAIVVKGYPRLSETFISHEMRAFELRGISFDIWSLRKPTDRQVHPVHRQIQATANYLPEYLHHAPLRVLQGAMTALRSPRAGSVLRGFLGDLLRDPTPSRLRRLGQAFVLVREIDPAIRHLHVHYLHTPTSVVRYACLLTGRTYSVSAHAKDIWTTPEWELRTKLQQARFTTVCSEAGLRSLRSIAPDARIDLVQHGLDPKRVPLQMPRRGNRDGSDPSDPVRLVSIGRAVEKKGFGDLVEALSMLPPTLHWRLQHIGGGDLVKGLKARAEVLGLASRIEWQGSQPEPDVFRALQHGDLFVLAARPGKGGDRDGLPNVLLEAASQEMAILATDFAAIPEFIRHGVEGVLVPPASPSSLATGLSELIVDPHRRAALGRAARIRLDEAFDFEAGVDRIAGWLRDVGEPVGAGGS